MDGQTITTIIALLCMTAMIISALVLGYDGAILATGVGVLAYVGGYKHRTARVPNAS